MRVISPSASRFRSVSVRTFGEISGMAFPMALNRVAGFSASIQRMSIAHFPEKREITFLTGHDDVQVYFFRFSFRGKLFIVNNGYFDVSDLRYCNVLFNWWIGFKFALS